MLTPPRCAGMSEIACICFSIRAVIGIHFSQCPLRPPVRNSCAHAQRSQAEADSTNRSIEALRDLIDRLVSGPVQQSCILFRGPGTKGRPRTAARGFAGRRTAWRRSSLTDTSDTVLRGNPGNERNHRNSSQRSNLLVTGSNTGYYGISIGFTGTCR